MLAKGLVVASVACAVALSADAATRKKAIGCGWCFNSVTVDDFLANADAFDRSGLDGVLVWLRGRDGKGKSVGMRNI